LYAELEFKTWLAELGGLNTSDDAAEQIESHYETILDKKSFARWIDKLSKASVFAFDTETTSIDAMQAELVGVSFAVESGE
ncbi:MAG: hypothetical protein VW771_03575, partial [Gammaproteobacteria bacterium]